MGLEGDEESECMDEVSDETEFEYDGCDARLERCDVGDAGGDGSRLVVLSLGSEGLTEA